ncbi:MAG: hypothetical protein CM15mP88_3450 [Pseudomonadota bacterium]|nr:MAG: hypothetical protein CM15mP88_3450 [Pseudomonadota bacterium]
MWLVEQSAGSDLGFLLIDYPGFGECEGSASPESILASSKAAWEHWQELYANQRTPQIGILGHSLGAAAALQLAENDFCRAGGPTIALHQCCRHGQKDVWFLADSTAPASFLKTAAL